MREDDVMKSNVHALVEYLTSLAYQVGLFTGTSLGLAMLLIGYGIDRRDIGPVVAGIGVLITGIVGAALLWWREVTPRRHRVVWLVGKAWSREHESSMIREPRKEEEQSRGSKRDDFPCVVKEKVSG